MTGGFTLILFTIIYSLTTTALHPRFKGGLTAGFILSFIGYVLQRYYRNKINAKTQQQEGQEHDVLQTSSFQLSSAMMLSDQRASDCSHQQPVPTYTLFQNTRISAVSRDIYGSHTVLDICDTQVPQPHSSLRSVRHEESPKFHSGHHTAPNGPQSPQRSLSSTHPLCPTPNPHHDIVASTQLESPSQEGSNIPSPDDDAPPSYDAVIRYNDLYILTSSSSSNPHRDIVASTQLESSSQEGPNIPSPDDVLHLRMML